MLLLIIIHRRLETKLNKNIAKWKFITTSIELTGTLKKKSKSCQTSFPSPPPGRMRSMKALFCEFYLGETSQEKSMESPDPELVPIPGDSGES